MKHAPAPPPPQAVEMLFGDKAGIAQRYADLLAGPGVERGLIGPREVDRIWERHILNSAVTVELFAEGELIVDIGSGAGLPGIPIAIARPDLKVLLVEPMLRRTEFLQMVAQEIGLHVDVIRGRAEDVMVREQVGVADAAVSRAVASLEKLARWSLPLLRPGGRMLALKGDRAGAELEESRRKLLGLGAQGLRVVRCGAGYVDPLTTVVVAERSAPHGGARRRRTIDHSK